MSTPQFKQVWVESNYLKQAPTHLNGCYEGVGRVTDPEDVWTIRMFHQFTAGASGQMSIFITSPRGVNSRSRGSGRNEHIRGIDDHPDAVLIEPNPDTVFQMFYISGNDGWVGNIYKKQKKDDSFKAAGTLDLKRGSNCH
jgi:hypothetical protein